MRVDILGVQVTVAELAPMQLEAHKLPVGNEDFEGAMDHLGKAAKAEQDVTKVETRMVVLHLVEGAVGSVAAPLLIMQQLAALVILIRHT